MKRIAKFHKVSFEQFKAGWVDTFGETDETVLKEKYDAGPTDGVPILEKSKRKSEYISLIVPTVDLAFPPRRVWSIITDGFKFSIHSTFGFSYFGSLPLTQALYVSFICR